MSFRQMKNCCFFSAFSMPRKMNNTRKHSVWMREKGCLKVTYNPISPNLMESYFTKFLLNISFVSLENFGFITFISVVNLLHLINESSHLWQWIVTLCRTVGQINDCCELVPNFDLWRDLFGALSSSAWFAPQNMIYHKQLRWFI